MREFRLCFALVLPFAVSFAVTNYAAFDNLGAPFNFPSFGWHFVDWLCVRSIFGHLHSVDPICSMWSDNIVVEHLEIVDSYLNRGCFVDIFFPGVFVHRRRLLDLLFHSCGCPDRSFDQPIRAEWSVASLCKYSITLSPAPVDQLHMHSWNAGHIAIFFLFLASMTC